MSRKKIKRILLKLSGEALMGDDSMELNCQLLIGLLQILKHYQKRK
jgi:uridylate kinase